MFSNVLKSLLPIIFIFFIISCSKDKNPVKQNSDYQIDPAIVETWIEIDSSSSSGLPPTNISGFKIDRNGGIDFLSVETNTGKLAIYNPPLIPNGHILEAKNDSLILELFPQAQHPGGIYQGLYTRTGNEVCFESQDSSSIPLIGGTYHSSKIGIEITPLLFSDFFVKINQDSFINAKIWPSPSAYCSNILINGTNSVIKIMAYDNRYFYFDFYFTNFNGVGSYVVGMGNDGLIHYTTLDGNQINTIYTFEPNSGTLQISEFDLIQNRCKGQFDFHISDINFTKGSFDIPIFTKNVK